MTDLSFSDLLMSPEADDELQEAFKAFSGGEPEVPEEKLGDILAGMGVKPTKQELDEMLERVGDKSGKIDFQGFKKMISQRSTTEADEKALMGALTFFGVDGKIDTVAMCAVIRAFCPAADDDDMKRLIAQGNPLDLQEFYLMLTEV